MDLVKGGKIMAKKMEKNPDNIKGRRMLRPKNLKKAI